jgi:nicotinate phosphoribosyltransferase
MAHSYISSFGDELEAFRAFARSFPDKTILLIDTYDTIAGAQKATIVGQEMAKEGHKLIGVRLDSGHMTQLSQEVRKILDKAGLDNTEIFASSSFDEYKIAKTIIDEYKIAKTIKEGASIDAFGVGTRMGVSSDAPYFDMAYKLVQYGARPIMKLSTGKVNLAGEKQVFRMRDPQGRFLEDVIGTRDETVENASPLLEHVMQDGRLLRNHPSLEEIRERFRTNFQALDDKFKVLQGDSSYTVTLSDRLKALQDTLSS